MCNKLVEFFFDKPMETHGYDPFKMRGGTFHKVQNQCKQFCWGVNFLQLGERKKEVAEGK
jgi:hypothetical protein